MFLINIFLFLSLLVSSFGQKVIEFNSRNLITFRGPIQGSTSTSWINQMNDRDPDTDTMYIYISSPGGSVLEGIKLVDQINTLEHSGLNVVCVADFAASMAFIILQSCPWRTATHSSVLMQHQMSLGLKGNLENVNNYLDFIHQINQNLEYQQATRMNMTVDDFSKKVMNDWWIPGHMAKNVSAIDEFVVVKCSKELVNKKDKISVRTIFGNVEIIYSKCPIAREPIDIKFVDSSKQKQHDWEEVEKEIQDFVPSLFIKNSVVASKKTKLY